MEAKILPFSEASSQGFFFGVTSSSSSGVIFASLIALDNEDTAQGVHHLVISYFRSSGA